MARPRNGTGIPWNSVNWGWFVGRSRVKQMLNWQPWDKILKTHTRSFYPANNMWRCKPPKPETDAEIHKRFKAFLHFFILYYEKEIATETDIITFEGFPSCFKWYRVVFTWKRKGTGEPLVRLFYNPEQAMKAMVLLINCLRKRYNWPKNERSWLKMNVAVLKQMEARADSLSL